MLTVTASADGYAMTSTRVTVASNTTIGLQLLPLPPTITTSDSDTIIGQDAPCVIQTVCKEFQLNLHRPGVIDATLTWKDNETWLWLELYKADDMTLIAQSG